MTKKFYFIILVFIRLLESCSSNKTPQEIFENSKSGVALICNQYYYSLNLPNGNIAYFSGIDREGNLNDFTFDLNEIKKHASIMTGTGFFINKEGFLLTNRHVVQPEVEQEFINKSFNAIIKSLQNLYLQQLSEIKARYQELESQKEECYTYLDGFDEYEIDEEKLQEIENKENNLKQAMTELDDFNKFVTYNFSADKLNIKAHTSICLAYNGATRISENENKCKVTKISNEPNVDLAVIRLDSGETPDNAFIFGQKSEEKRTFVGDIKSLFNKKEKKDKSLHIDQELYMIGYNAGPTLAFTNQGLQVQLTSGKITQEPDGSRILYSIPTMKGSSGSPVIDAEGNLVAVNFAKMIESDNFNFGIPLNKISNFLNSK